MFMGYITLLGVGVLCSGYLSATKMYVSTLLEIRWWGGGCQIPRIFSFRKTWMGPN